MKNFLLDPGPAWPGLVWLGLDDFLGQAGTLHSYLSISVFIIGLSAFSWHDDGDDGDGGGTTCKLANKIIPLFWRCGCFCQSKMETNASSSKNEDYCRI